MGKYYDAKFCREAYEKYQDFAERVWAGYKIYARGSSVIRKGFEDIGVTIRTDDSLDYVATFYRRGESDLEHQAKVAWLASVFMANLPEYFGGERYFILPIDIWLRMNVALTHDVGEVEIGDIMDDGGPEHSAKDSAELAAFRKILIAYPDAYRHEATRLFRAFQQKDSREAEALVALDKLDAILTNLLLEEQGACGTLSFKPHFTESDQCFMRSYKTNAAADIWCAHMVDRTVKGFSPEIMAPVIAVLIAASLDVRGEELTCIKKQ